jgi:class 3 adenylate cyclase/ABC-type transport system substrate-binding protein
MTAPSPSSITFADLLRHHRTAAGLTQEELAARAQLSRDAISTLERGTRRRPRKDTVALLADALALPDEERAAFATAARRSPASSLAATPPLEAAVTLLDGHVPALGSDVALPHGVVTFLFADIEGSTRLLHQLGDRYAGVLAAVQALLGAAWAAHAGHELGAQGDHFFAVFAYAEDALAAAAAAQQALAAHSWPDGAPVRLRMGVHTGAALLTAGRYVGLEVHRAACIAAAGHGGQVVVSRPVADQVAKFGYELPAGTRLRDLGTHRLEELPHREELYQLVVPDLPGLPATYPPLRTLDAWPGLRADLTVVVMLSAVLLAVVGLVLPLVVPAFPQAIGLGAAGLTGLVLLASLLARPVRRALVSQWRDARKPFVTVTSSLLSLVVVLTTLFVTKPPIYIGPPHLGYDFSYTYHVPTRTGGTVTVGLEAPIEALTPFAPFASPERYYGLWQSCVTGLPDGSFKPDQCTEVPSVANGGEDPQGKWTILHIDPRAVWSDGWPISADDYLFVGRLVSDPNIGGGFFPGMLTKLDARTVRVDWSVSFGDFLTLLLALSPLPLHVYATGKFAGVYDPASGAYNSALAQQLVTSASYFTQIPVDDGPFTVQSFLPGHRAVLVRNSRFFSSFFHRPALDGVTFVTVNPQWPHGLSHSQVVDVFVAGYRQSVLDLVEGLGPFDLSRLGGVPKAQVITSPLPSWIELGFNQRGVAPNARANQGVSIFSDRNVRRAFVEAFDRCAAVRAQLGAVNCTDPNLFTDELTVAPAPDYDPSVKLPAYNPVDAAHLLTRAGYPVVDGIRRYKDGRTPLQLIIDVAPGGAGAPLIGPRMQRDYMRNLQIPIALVSAREFFHGGPVGQATTGAFDIALFEDDGAPDPTVNVNFTTLAGTDAKDIPSAQKPFLLGVNFLGIIDSWVVQQEQLGSETIDAAQRAGVYRELQRRWAQQFYVEPVFIVVNVTLTKPTLCNFKKYVLLGDNTWNMADWYVAPSCPS